MLIRLPQSTDYQSGVELENYAVRYSECRNAVIKEWAQSPNVQ